MEKLNTYEVLNKLAQATEYSVENMSSTEPSQNSSDNILSNNYAETLSVCLKHIYKVIVSADQILGLPSGLPLKVAFERPKPIYDPHPNLYHMFSSCRFLECLFILVTSNNAINQPLVLHTIRDIFRQLMRMQSGLLYLSSRPNTTNGIIRVLTQSIEYNQEECTDDVSSQQLGVDLIYHLRTLQCVDQLRNFHKTVITDDYDMYECLETVRFLYMMTFTPVGRHAVINVLTLDTNVECLLDFIPLDEESQEKPKKSSCTLDFTISLLLLIAQHGENIDFLQKYASRLLSITKTEENTKLAEIGNWLNVTSSFTHFTYAGLDSIIVQLKSYKEDLCKLPKGLVTTLRVAKSLAVLPEYIQNIECESQLKYTYVISQLYSADCLSLLIHIIKSMSEVMMHSWKQGMLTETGKLHTQISVIKPAMSLIKVITVKLIEAKKSLFKDTTALQTLFDVHSVICTMPPPSAHSYAISVIQKDLIDTIAAYTKPMVISSESEDALAQSLWCQTLKELFKYTLKAPYAYVSGLMILSELLPLPLPIQSREPMSDEELTAVITSRKLWCAHLHPVTSDIQTLIQQLSCSTCHAQQQILRRVCWQLTDLSCQMATLIVKYILDTILTTLGELNPPKTDEGEQSMDIIASTQLCQLLDLLQFNLTQPVFKAAVLSLTKDGSVEEKYTQTWPKLMAVFNTAADKPTHFRAQEIIAAIVQTVCDPDISLLPQDADITVIDQLANALPENDLMALLTSSMVEHIGHRDRNYSSVLPCLRTMVMLTDHNYGFYHLKKAFDKHSTSLQSLLMRINVTFSKDSSDCLSSLSTVLELLRLLATVPQSDDDQSIVRDLKLSAKDLRTILQWEMPSSSTPGVPPTPDEDHSHPLELLETLLECSKDEENLQSLFESIVLVTQMIKSEQEEDATEFTVPEMNDTFTLSEQFSQRTVYNIAEPDDDRLNYFCWLSNPANEDNDIEADKVTFDVQTVCKKYLPHINVMEELRRDFTPTEANLVKPRKIKDKRKEDTYITKTREKPFVAPMRGRGIVTRGMPPNGRGDPFRSRPANTSRPPSMHVDDFIKMERNSANAPPSPPRRPEKEGPPPFVPRGRGYDRGRFMRGRPFFARGFYPRDRGGHMNAPRGRPFDHNQRMSPDRRFIPHDGQRFMRGGRRGWGRVRGKDPHFMSPPDMGNRDRRDLEHIPFHSRSITK